jgi:hypothetical protein
MAIAYSEIAGTGPSSSSVSSPSLDISSATEGALLLLCVGSQDSITPGTTPSGWTQVGYSRNSTLAGARGWCTVYSKVAGASETTVSVPMSGAGYTSASVVQVSGSDATVGSVAISNDGTVDVSYPTTPSITIASGGDAVLVVGSGDTGDTPDITAPSGFTEIVDRFGARRSGIFVGKQSFPSGGTTGVLGTIRASGAEYNTIILELGSGTPSISPSTRENGFDIDVSSSNTDTTNYSIKVNGGTAFNPQSVLRTGASSARLRVPNGSRILSGDTVTLSSTADSTADESVTNNSKQTSTTIWDDGIVRTFSSPPTVGILASGEFQITDAVAISGESYDETPGTDDQYTIHGSTRNPAAGTDAEHPFHPDAFAYNASTAESYPLSLSAQDCLVAAAAFPAMSTYATSTPFALGDCVFEGSRYWRVTTAGTTSGTKPAFSSSVDTYTDGTVVWTRGTRTVNGDQGRSPVRKMSVLYCAGSSLLDQSAFRPAYTSGATKRFYTTDEVDETILPSDANGYTDLNSGIAAVQRPWFDLGYLLQSSANAVPEENQPTYSTDVSTAARDGLMPMLSSASYKTELVYYIVQRGIDQLGIRDGGGYPGDDSAGRSQGRMSFALAAAALLNAESTFLPILKSNGIATDWDGSEFGAQLFYIDESDTSRILDSGFNYGDGLASGTYYNPSVAVSTYSDSPANAAFPASVRGSWLHVPEWGIRHAQDPDRDSPTWSYTPSVTHYRQCCTAAYWAYIAYMCERLGLAPSLDGNSAAFFDYLARYEYIQGPDGADSSWNDASLWTLYESNRDAYSVVSSNLSGTTLTVTFNRYTTGTDAAWQTAVAGSGSTTCTGATQTGPRTWEFTLSGAPASGETIDYTAASGDAVDAGNNALPDIQLNQPAQLLPATTPGAGAIAGSTTITLTYSEPIENTISPLPAADITVSNAATGNAELVTENPIVSGSTITIVYEGDPAATDAALTVSLNNGDNHVLTVSNGLPIASLSGQVVTVTEAGGVSDRGRMYDERGAMRRGRV